MSKNGKLANIISQQLRFIVTALVGLLVVRLIFKQLGTLVYANLAIVLSIINLVAVLSSALTGAVMRFLTQNITEKKYKEASSYYTNSFFSVLLIGLVCFLIIIAGLLLNENTWGHLPAAFTLVMILIPILNAFAGILASSNFYTEQFVSSSIIFISGQIIYLALVWWALVFTTLSIWGIALANICNGLLVCILLWYLFDKKLPEITFDISLFSWKKIRSFFLFVGWMLLAYIGIYMVTSGVLILAKNYVSTFLLTQLALVFQVGSLVNRSLTNFGILTSPATYKYLAKRKYKGATLMVERFWSLAISFGLLAAIIGFLEGDSLLHLWLGKEYPTNTEWMLLGGIVSFTIGTLNIPVSVFFAGINKVKFYGLVTLAEGIFVILLSFLLFTFGTQYAELVIWLPAIVTAIKIAAIILTQRRFLSISGIRKYLSFLLHLALTSAALLIVQKWLVHIDIHYILRIVLLTIVFLIIMYRKIKI